MFFFSSLFNRCTNFLLYFPISSFGITITYSPSSYFTVAFGIILLTIFDILNSILFKVIPLFTGTIMVCSPNTYISYSVFPVTRSFISTTGLARSASFNPAGTFTVISKV
uniref:Uncharacterized protein ORF-c21_026 n=1 Tax=Saccharolobus solfataricus TaxID=2287 RepID=Q9UWX6_SACSO|nr:hypothetical protein [Saccharolobus solfataricus P2]